jgi:hypothetical protein
MGDEPLWLNALAAPYRRLYGRVGIGIPVSTPRFFIHAKIVKYSNCWSGEISYLYSVLRDLWKIGMSANSGFKCSSSCS